jgi:hypothetical protein
MLWRWRSLITRKSVSLLPRSAHQRGEDRLEEQEAVGKKEFGGRQFTPFNSSLVLYPIDTITPSIASPASRVPTLLPIREQSTNP